MRSLNTVEDRVLSILKKNKEARDDDMKLYVMVCSSYFNCKDNDISKMPFGFVMASYKELNIPHFESVRRSRAKIQSAHPELACLLFGAFLLATVKFLADTGTDFTHNRAGFGKVSTKLLRLLVSPFIGNTFDSKILGVYTKFLAEHISDAHRLKAHISATVNIA